jgi:hypothetical protein
MAEIIVGVFVLFIIGILSKKKDGSKHQEHFLPIFFGDELKRREPNEDIEMIEPDCEGYDRIDEFEDNDF